MAAPTENRDGTGRGRRSAFSLIELLVVVGVIALLLAILIPSLCAAREQVQALKCASNLRNLGLAFQMYADEYGGFVMPLAYFHEGAVTYWWGRDDPEGIDHHAGFTSPYLPSALEDGGAYECPTQAWGTYEAVQGESGEISSTYGYNGYYLAPSQTPGWSFTIGHRPWQKIERLRRPAEIFVFADAMIDWDGLLKNTALLDPPYLFGGRSWRVNPYPTTSFRHRGRSNIAHADGHASSYAARVEWLVSADLKIGSVRASNDPHYVPDWREW